MGLFDNIKAMFFNKPKEPWQARLITTQQPDNIVFTVALAHHSTQQLQQQKLPIKADEDIAPVDPGLQVQFDCLQQLSNQGVLQYNPDQGYILAADKVHLLDPEDRGILKLPFAKGWSLDLKLAKAFGHRRAQAQVRWTDPNNQYLGQNPAHLTSTPYGFFDNTNNQAIVLPPQAVELRDTTEAPAQHATEAEEARYLAKVQSALETFQQSGADQWVSLNSIDAQLHQEAFLAPTQIKVNLREQDDGSLELYPQMTGVEDLDTARKIMASHQRQKVFTQRTGVHKTGRIRVALDPHVHKELQRLRQHRVIVPKDRARFIKDPRAFLQPPTERDDFNEDAEEQEDVWETLDLSPLVEQIAQLNVEDFGSRVVEIGVQEAPAPLQRRAPSLAGSWFEVDEDHDDLFDQDLYEVLSAARELIEEPAEASGQPAQTSLIVADNSEVLNFDAGQHRDLNEGFQQYGPPTDLQCSLFPHQQVGYTWLRNLEALPAGGLLADDMGLGKTVQIIGLMAHLHDVDQLSPSLVVAPKSVISNWLRELRRFFPKLRRVAQHTGTERVRRLDYLKNQEVILTTYDTLRHDQLLLGQLAFHVMVCDEAQYIKNYTTKRASACRAMNARLKLALTATPVENRMEELWAIMDFCQPGLIGSLRSFTQTYIEPIESEDRGTVMKASQALRECLGHHYLRRTKEQHLSDKLPDKIIHRAPLPMTQDQRVKYNTTVKWLKEQPWNPGGALQALRHLLEICTHPLAANPDFRRHDEDDDAFQAALRTPQRIIDQSPKFRYCIEVLDEVKAQRERAVVFVHNRRAQKLLWTALRDQYRLNVQIINGKTPGPTRQRIVETFNNNTDFDVLILSPLAAGVGLNITGANHVIHLMRMWNPAKENQATDRTYRIGQTRDVHVHIPITTHDAFTTADVRLDQLLESKRALAEKVIQPREGMTLTQAEIKACIFDEPTQNATQTPTDPTTTPPQSTNKNHAHAHAHNDSLARTLEKLKSAPSPHPERALPRPSHSPPPQWTSSASDSRFILMPALQGGLMMTCQPLTGLLPFVTRLQVKIGDWHTTLLANNARHSSWRTPIAPASEHCEVVAVGFEDDLDVQRPLKPLRLPPLAHYNVSIFKLDKQGVGQLIQGQKLIQGNAYRLLLPPTKTDDCAPLTSTPDPDNPAWGIVELNLNATLTPEQTQRLESWGLIVETKPATISLAVSPHDHHTTPTGERIPSLTPDTPVLCHVTVESHANPTSLHLTHQGPSSTKTVKLPSNTSQFIALTELEEGHHGLEIRDDDPDSRSSQLFFHIGHTQHRLRRVHARCSLHPSLGYNAIDLTNNPTIRGDLSPHTRQGHLLQDLSLPPCWPGNLHWQNLHDNQHLNFYADPQGTMDLDWLEQSITTFLKDSMRGTLTLDFGDLGSLTLQHELTLSAATKRIKKHLSDALDDLREGTTLSTDPFAQEIWLEKICQLLGYRAQKRPGHHGDDIRALWELSTFTHDATTQNCRRLAALLVLAKPDTNLQNFDVGSVLERAKHLNTDDLFDRTLITDATHWTLAESSSQFHGPTNLPKLIQHGHGEALDDFIIKFMARSPS